MGFGSLMGISYNSRLVQFDRIGSKAAA